MTITIYHAEARRSERVAWLLEELGVPYGLDFIQGDILGSLLALEAHHEMRMTPIVEDGDVVMVESSAILEYLLAKYGKGSSLRPSEDSKEFPAYLTFLHFAEGTAMQKIIADRLTQSLEEAQKKAGDHNPQPKLPGVAGSRTGSERILHYAENTLSKQPYFAGETFTAADIMMHFPLKLGAPVASGEAISIAGSLRTDHAYLDAFPNVKRYLVAMADRPAFQRAMQTTMPKGPPAM
jgi:glutathione S-transferase